MDKIVECAFCTSTKLRCDCDGNTDDLYVLLIHGYPFNIFKDMETATEVVAMLPESTRKEAEILFVNSSNILIDDYYSDSKKEEIATSLYKEVKYYLK